MAYYSIVGSFKGDIDIDVDMDVPGKPVAYNDGLLSVNCGLLWDIVAYFFGLLGVPGSYSSAFRTQLLIVPT